LATPNSVVTGTSIGVQVTLLPSAAAPVKHGQALRMLFGTDRRRTPARRAGRRPPPRAVYSAILFTDAHPWRRPCP
jgi:hypothetical protein